MIVGLGGSVVDAVAEDAVKVGLDGGLDAVVEDAVKVGLDGGPVVLVGRGVGSNTGSNGCLAVVAGGTRRVPAAAVGCSVGSSLRVGVGADVGELVG